MFKISGKTLLLIGSLLITQCNSIKAGAGDYNGLIPAFVMVGVTGIGIGAVGGFGLYKSIQWARKETGLKRALGYGILTTTGVATLLGLGYAMGKIK